MIRRVLRAATLNARLQARAYFLHTYAGATGLTVLFLLFAIPETAVAWVLPLVLFAEPGMLGINMVGAFRYLEQGEGTVAALLVTPLRPVEYLAGLALASATIGATFGALAFGIVTFDPGLAALSFLPLFGVGFLSSLVGFVLSMRYADFPRFILGAIPWVGLWQLPLLAHFEVVPWAAVAWVPSAPGLAALANLSGPDPSVAWILAASLVLLALCVPGTLWAARTYDRTLYAQAVAA